MNARWLVTGAAGMLGRDLVTLLRADPRVTLTAHTRADLDLTDASRVTDAVADHHIVINAAAWTDVDAAETAEDAATAINGTAVATLATACAAAGARLLHVSTDYVFAGDAHTPYPEDAPTDPINAYGRSKLVGEHAVRTLLPTHGYIVRTAWLYSAHGRNFATTMLRLAHQRDTIDVVNDQHGQPTWSWALAEQLATLGHAALAGTAPAGTYHATASGETTWYGFAREIFAQSGLDPQRIHPTTTDSFPRPAPRPRYSVLGHDRWRQAGLTPMADWRDQLRRALTPPGLPSSESPHHETHRDHRSHRAADPRVHPGAAAPPPTA